MAPNYLEFGEEDEKLLQHYIKLEQNLQSYVNLTIRQNWQNFVKMEKNLQKFAKL